MFFRCFFWLFSNFWQFNRIYFTVSMVLHSHGFSNPFQAMFICQSWMTFFKAGHFDLLWSGKACSFPFVASLFQGSCHDVLFQLSRPCVILSINREITWLEDSQKTSSRREVLFDYAISTAVRLERAIKDAKSMPESMSANSADHGSVNAVKRKNYKLYNKGSVWQRTVLLTVNWKYTNSKRRDWNPRIMFSLKILLNMTHCVRVALSRSRVHWLMC